MFEVDESVMLDMGLPGQCFVIILEFLDDDEYKLQARVRDFTGQEHIVSIFRLYKPF